MPASLFSILWAGLHFIPLSLVYGSEYKGGLVAENQNNKIILTDILSKVEEYSHRLALFSFGQIREDYNLWNKKIFPWYINESSATTLFMLFFLTVLLTIYLNYGLTALSHLIVVFATWTSFNVLVYMGIERHFYFFAFAPFLALAERINYRYQILSEMRVKTHLAKSQMTSNLLKSQGNTESSELQNMFIRISIPLVALSLLPSITYTVQIVRTDKNHPFSAAASFGEDLDKSRTYAIMNSSLYPSLLLDNHLKIISLFGPEVDRKQTIPVGQGFNSFRRNLVYGGEIRSDRLRLICSSTKPTLVSTYTTYRVISSLPGVEFPVLGRSKASMVTDEGDFVIIDLAKMCQIDPKLDVLKEHIS